jgi:hypothetical protein
MTNSIGGGPNSPLASPPAVTTTTGKVSRRSSGWAEVLGDDIVDADKVEDARGDENARPH